MSFRKYGGIDYSERNNIVKNNYTTTNNLTVTDTITPQVTTVKGEPGNPGEQGATGPTGSPGAKGDQGNVGKNGNDGKTGPTGTPGEKGGQGGQGSPGKNGDTGPTGPTGTPGTNGTDGKTGATGKNGTDGTPGKNGTDGKTGPTGETGAPGKDGADALPTYGSFNNFGLNWNPMKPNAVWSGVAISETGQYQTAVSSGSGTGLICTSRNFGVDWDSSNNLKNDWKSIAMSSTGKYQTALIDSGNIYYSNNYGDSWSPVSWSTSSANTFSFAWSSICMSSSGQNQLAVTSGSAGSMFFSSNYGVSWKTVTVPVVTDTSVTVTFITGTGNVITGNFISASMSSTGQYQTVLSQGESGLIYTSNDYGVSWKNLNSNLKNDWQSVSLSQSGQYQTICAQYSQNIYISSDYGVSWKPIYITIGQPNFFSVSVSGNGQYQSAVVNDGGSIYVSSNYGLNWSLVPNSNGNWTSNAISTNGQYQIASDKVKKFLYQSISNNTGSQGPTGATGLAGTNGSDGKPGETGATGAPGKNGTDGATGPKGEQGVSGRDGQPGLPGNAGNPGPQGPAGPKGDSGDGGYWSLTSNTLSPMNTYNISGTNANFTGTVGIATTSTTIPLSVKGNSGALLKLQNNTAVYKSGSSNIEFWTNSDTNNDSCPLGSITTLDKSDTTNVFSTNESIKNTIFQSQMSFNVNLNSTSTALVGTKSLVNGMILNGVYNSSGDSNFSQNGANLTINGCTLYSGLTQNPMPAGLTITTTTGTERLYLGAYDTQGGSSACAIQAVDFTSNNDSAEPLLLNPKGGNVGIKQINPQYTLDVNGTINASGNIYSGGSTSGLLLQGTTNGSFIRAQSGPLYLGTGLNNYVTITSINSIGYLKVGSSLNMYSNSTDSFIQNTTNGYLHLVGSTSNSGVLVDSNGRVGIMGGTDNSYALNVTGNINVQGASGTLLRLQNNTDVYQGGSANIEFWTLTGICPLGSISTTDLSTTTTNNGKFQSKMSFNVNYNSSSISTLVNGMTLTGISSTSANLSVNGTVSVSSDITAVSYNATSDYRIKENVEPLNEDVIVDNLRPVTYINKKSKKRDIGLIAHELQEHYPFLVSGEKDGTETQSVNYTGLIGILIKEIQELKKTVKELKTRVTVLESNK